MRIPPGPGVGRQSRPEAPAVRRSATARAFILCVASGLVIVLVLATSAVDSSAGWSLPPALRAPGAVSLAGGLTLIAWAEVALLRTARSTGGFGDAPEVGRWVFSTNGVAVMGMHGIPCIGFGPGDEDKAHAPNELTRIDDLVSCSAFYAMLPFSLAGRSL